MVNESPGGGDREAGERRFSRRDILRAGIAAPVVLSLPAIAGAAGARSGGTTSSRPTRHQDPSPANSRQRTEKLVAYWNGPEPTPPAPTLDQIPAYVDIVPIAPVYVDQNYQLDFTDTFGLTLTHSASVIQGWIKTLRARGPNVLFSLLNGGGNIQDVPDVDAFVGTVVQNAQEWGVDGIDIDISPVPNPPPQTVLDITHKLRPELRDALHREPVLTFTLEGPYPPDYLRTLAADLDLLTTQNYGASFSDKTSAFNQIAAAIGAPEKVAIGVTCNNPLHFDPLQEVAQLSQWEPPTGRKGGIMLYSASYDVQSRLDHGTGYPDWTFTRTIHANLP